MTRRRRPNKERFWVVYLNGDMKDGHDFTDKRKAMKYARHRESQGDWVEVVEYYAPGAM